MFIYVYRHVITVVITSNLLEYLIFKRVHVCMYGVRNSYLLVSDEIPAENIVHNICRRGPARIYRHGNLAAVHALNVHPDVDPLVHLYVHTAVVRVGVSRVLVR